MQALPELEGTGAGMTQLESPTALTSLKPRQAAREVVPGGEICTLAWLGLVGDRGRRQWRQCRFRGATTEAKPPGARNDQDDQYRDDADPQSSMSHTDKQPTAQTGTVSRSAAEMAMTRGWSRKSVIRLSVIDGASMAASP